MLYLQKCCATLFSKKSFKYGRDSLQSILKPLFAIFQEPHPVLVSGFTHTWPAKSSLSPRSSHRVHDFHNIAHSNINTSFDPLNFITIVYKLFSLDYCNTQAKFKSMAMQLLGGEQGIF